MRVSKERAKYPGRFMPRDAKWWCVRKPMKTTRRKVRNKFFTRNDNKHFNAYLNSLIERNAY